MPTQAPRARPRPCRQQPGANMLASIMRPLLLLSLTLCLTMSAAQPPLASLPSATTPCSTTPQLCARLKTGIQLQLAAHRAAAASGALDAPDQDSEGDGEGAMAATQQGQGLASSTTSPSPAPSRSSSLQASLLKGSLLAATTATASSPSPRRSPSPSPRRWSPPRPPAPIRILPQFQLRDLGDLGVGSAQQVEADIKAVVWASIRVIQDYVKVKRPVGSSGLLARPFYLNQTTCDQINSRTATQSWTCDGPGWNPMFGASLPPLDFKNPYCGMGDINASHMLSTTCFNETTGEWKPNCIRNAAGGSGGQKADMYLYVTADQTLCYGGTLAYSLPCLYDWKTNRPVAGNLNICSDGLTGSLSRVLSIAVHELVHVLGFSSDAYELYVDSNNKELGLGRVMRNATAPSGSDLRSGRMIISPKVVQQARLQFNCSTLAGAFLEDQGDEGSAGSHWEQELFQGDAMVPTSSSWDGSQTRISRVTLALLEDSGWYVTNIANAPYLDWGRNAGCALPQRKCEAAGAPFFCDQGSPTASRDLNCSFDGRSRGLCIANQFSSCGMWMVRGSDRDSSVREPACNSQLYYQVSGQSQLDAQGAAPFGWSIGPGSRCAQVLLPFTSTSPPANFLVGTGVTSYCWPARCTSPSSSSPTNTSASSSSSSPTSSLPASSPTSPTSASTAAPEGTPTPAVQYSIRGRWLDCPVGATLQMSDFFGGNLTGRVVCPTTQLQAAAMCRGLDCPPGCGVGLSQGVCFEGKCVCRLGWGGANCSLSYLYMSLLALNASTTTPVL